ncbi:MAG: sodium:solute symporter family protein [Balneolaceae bacterium]
MTTVLSPIDWLLVAGYFGLLLYLSWRKRADDSNESDYLLSGRTITLPAFVATLVSTWYGGILGIGEWSYQFGVSQFLILAVPFYLFSALFAILLAGKVRLNPALSLPEAMGTTYSGTAGRISALPVFILVSPAPYILMLALLFQFLTGGEAPVLFYAAVVALFSIIYITIGGFQAVVRTDILQIVLMFSGFILLIGYAVADFGGIPTLLQALPDSHLDITGGNSWQYILVWFFIALWTFVDPSFHQRAAAANSPETAKRGIFISIGFWLFFDILTCTAGLYAFAILGGGLEQPLLAYPELAATLLPAGAIGLFFVSLLATIMSTLDSYLFLSGQTMGRDFLHHFRPASKPNRLTKYGFFLSGLIGVLLIILYPSVIDLWYVIGSVFIPALLIPVLGIYLPLFRMGSGAVILNLILSSLVSLAWLMLGTWFPAGDAGYLFMGWEPFYPGLGVSLLIWVASRLGAMR